MPKAVFIEEFGGPGVMKMTDIKVSHPSDHEAHINLESRSTTGSTILKP